MGTFEYADVLVKARAGDRTAMFNLAVFHNLRGDLDDAISWYEMAAHAGDVTAMAYLGWVFKMRANTEEAIAWSRKAVAAGHQQAQTQLRDLLQPHDNSSVAAQVSMITGKNMGAASASLGLNDQARQQWTLAADAGDTESMYNIGVLSERTESLGPAILWHERAAREGFDPSMLRLGQIHSRRGEMSQALMWFEKASTAGNVEARQMLAEMGV